jgi:CIC family chloride channel protein
MKQRMANLSRETLAELKRVRGVLLRLRVVARLRPTDRQALLIWAAVAGFLGASAALLFKAATNGVQWLLTAHHGGYVTVFGELPVWQRMIVPILGAGLAGLTLLFGERFIRRKATDYMEAIALGDGVVPVRASLVRSIAAMFSIASGEAIGREGPLVQLAAVTASLVARVRNMAPPRRRLLVACGAGAGIAAAYNTPLGGALFVAEIVLGSIAMESLGPLLIASVVSVLTVHTFADAEPLYRFEDFTLRTPWEIILYAVLGGLAGVGASLWMRFLRLGKAWFGQLAVPLVLRLMLGGVIVGALAAWHPEVTGNGASVIRGILAGQYPWRLVAVLIVLKIIATTAAFGSGAVGGVFTPSLLIGGAGGFLFSVAVATVWPWGDLNAGGFALVAMGAFLAAAAQAPVTAILMLFEMTLQYEIVLPLMVAAVIAYYTSRSLAPESLYGESLRAGPRSVFDQPLASITVQALMRPEPETVKPAAPFREIATSFLRSPARELWITDQADVFRGAVLLPEVQPFLKEAELAETVIAADILRDDIPSLKAGQSLPSALETFAHSDCENLPVVDAESGKLLGAIGRSDLFLTISELTRRESTSG